MRKLGRYPEVDMHPDTARNMDIREGDWVWIETPQIKKGKG